MLSALAAELMKFRRHRATWSLVWIFPIGIFLFYAIGILNQLVRGTPPDPAAPSSAEWIANAAGFWGAPAQGLTRYLISAFVAVVFAGEYGWNTWKLIIPHRARTSLIAGKYAAVLLLLYAAFILAALLVTGMRWLEDVATGDPMPAIGLGALAWAHVQGLAAGLPIVLLTIAYTSLAAVLTRSTTAAIIISIVVATLEQLFRTFGPMLSFYIPGPVELLYQVLPGYHIFNLSNWITEGTPLTAAFPGGGTVSYGWAASLAIAAAWIVGLAALTITAFRRQDIN
jgi:ABC-2 type transport system permease protein